MGLPVIETTKITQYSLLGFEVECNLTDLGGESVSDRGIVWFDAPNPTRDNWYVSQGGKDSTGSFLIDYPGKTLKINTIYYVRAYATNDEGTAYGEELSFSISPAVPIVRTVKVMDIVSGEAYEGMPSNTETPGFTIVVAVDNLGDDEVTEFGFCFGKHPNPTTLGEHRSMGKKTSPGNKVVRYSGTIFEDETYYVRAYAENSTGLAYGNDISFGGLSLYKWVFIATPDHSQLLNLDKDDHPQYLTEERHRVQGLHVLGETVPHDIHARLGVLGADDHPQYLTIERHDTKERHPLGSVIPYAEPITNGDADNPELVFDGSGDVIVGEVEL